MLDMHNRGFMRDVSYLEKMKKREIIGTRTIENTQVDILLHMTIESNNGVTSTLFLLRYAFLFLDLQVRNLSLSFDFYSEYQA